MFPRHLYLELSSFKIYVLLWLSVYPFPNSIPVESRKYSFLYFKTIFTKAFYTIIFAGKYLWNKRWNSKPALIRKCPSSDLIPPAPSPSPLEGLLGVEQCEKHSREPTCFLRAHCDCPGSVTRFLFYLDYFLKWCLDSYLFCFWLCWVFVAVWAFSLVAESWGCSRSSTYELLIMQMSLPWLRSWWCMGIGCSSRAPERRPSGWGAGLSCSETRGIFLEQKWTLCLLRWHVDSSPLSHQGSPLKWFFKNKFKRKQIAIRSKVTLPFFQPWILAPWGIWFILSVSSSYISSCL